VKLSTRARYGVRALFELAVHYGEGPLPLRQVAASQGLSERYLEQLAAPLRQAGLVRSVRGAQGGYVLGKPPQDITVAAIFRVLEGPISLTDCARDDPPGGAIDHCGRAEGCVARNIWTRVNDSIIEVLDGITLADLLRDAGLGRPQLKVAGEDEGGL